MTVRSKPKRTMIVWISPVRDTTDQTTTAQTTNAQTKTYQTTTG